MQTENDLIDLPSRRFRSMLRPPPLLLASLALAGLLRPAAAFTPAEAKMPMTVTLVRSDAAGCGADCPEWLALTGVIGPGTPALFSAALARLGRRNVPVLVDSPGGAVQPAMAMGRIIRARKMTVVVAGTGLDDCAPADRACTTRRHGGERQGFVAGGIAACASACVLVLAAGTERSVGPNSFVGVHQMVVHQTLTRVMNYFRIMRRMVNGHPVEISRTLVSTRPISSRQIQKAAPETMYSEVDRYLLGLGVAESIMPLMRSAPPNGIHWMTPTEVAATRIATDTTDARTLMERSAAMAEPPRPSAMAVATSRLAAAPQAGGIVDWSVTRPVGPGKPSGFVGAPVLAATAEVPALHLRGTVVLRRDEAPGGAGGFLATVDFGDPAAIESGRTWSVGAPSLCSPSECLPYFAPVAETDDGHGRREFRVKAGWTDGFLAHLAAGTSVLIPLTAADGAKGFVSLALTDGTRPTIQEWEHLCCGLSPAEAAPAAGRPAPEEKAATAFWTVLRDGSQPPQPGATFLLGSIEVPDAGLRLSLEAGLAPRGSGGGVVMALHLVPDIVRFGPATALTVETVQASGRGIAMVVGSAHARALGGFDLTLAVTAPLPRDATLALTMTDARGREIRVAVPMPGALWELLADARLLPS